MTARTEQGWEFCHQQIEGKVASWMHRLCLSEQAGILQKFIDRLLDLA
jgi:hypothetical protein